jgi:hypothetical protein
MTSLPVISVTDRYRLKELDLSLSATVPAGRVMFCRGRKVLGYGDVAEIANVLKIPRGADTICLAETDYHRVKAWLG